MTVTDFAYVDIETTGGNTVHDRITEVAWIHVREGQIIDQQSQLINPERFIPFHIQQFTGITNEMVAQCPAFEAIAVTLADQLSDKVFVAHNARFDYGFLQVAFKRCGIDFSAPVLCTVRLSRRLYPEHKRHNLDSLIARHDLHCKQRHRALGDALVMHQFVEQAKHTRGVEVVQQHIDELLKTPRLPPGLDSGALDTLPEGPGVYIFYDANDSPLYVGKSVHIRHRVLSHFSSAVNSARAMKIQQQLARIETIATAGELGALLKEAQLVKALRPLHNRKLRPCRELFTIYFDAAQLDSPPSIRQVDRDLLARADSLFGLFKSKKQATNRLQKLAVEYDLCLQALGLESGSGPCFNHQLKKCRGVCAGQEQPLQHQLRVIESLSALKISAWPYGGPVALREVSAGGTQQETHVVDQWYYLGSITVDSQCHPSELLERSVEFDLDVYHILNKYLSKQAAKLEVIKLY